MGVYPNGEFYWNNELSVCCNRQFTDIVKWVFILKGHFIVVIKLKVLQ
jgi:hypothetical protein